MDYGCREPQKDIRDYKIEISNLDFDFPDSFELTKPKVKNQGKIGSCVAHAMSSALEYYIDNCATLSTDFIYGMDDDDLKGMSVASACSIAAQYGDMLETDCPGNTEVPQCKEKVETALQDADKVERAETFKIHSYYKCNTNDDIKYALYTGNPVLVVISWYEKYSLTNDYVISFNKQTNAVNHCVLIYGWNEKGFITLNSWGKSFGNKGTFIIPFDYTIKDARMLYKVKDAVNVPKVKEENLKIPSKINFIKPVYTILNFILNYLQKKK